MNDLSQTILTLTYAVTLVGAVMAMVMQAQARQNQESPPALPSGKVKVWFYRPGDLICSFLLFGLFAGLFVLAMFMPEADMSEITAAALVFGVGFQLVITAAVVIFAMRNTNANQWLGLRWKGWPWLFVIAPASVVTMALFMWVIQAAGYMAWMESLGAEPKQDTVVLLETTKDPLILILMIITAVIVAPLWEEIVFRGYLHPVLKKYGGIWTGAIFSSLLFAVVHNSLAAMLPLFLLALLMVWLYERTGSIWTPIAIHACFNAAAVIGTVVVRNNESMSAVIHALPFF